ncbi:MAG: PPC domain-containing protein [bacterium]
MRLTRLSLVAAVALLCAACGSKYNAGNNNNTSQDCGNDVLDSGEQCDGSALDGQTCVSLGFLGGNLACDGDCTLNVEDCEVPLGCGNGVLDPGEACDGVNLGGQSCEGLGYDGGALACTLACRFDVQACTSDAVCGDGVVRAPVEECDTSNMAGENCISLGFDTGTLECDASCRFDTSGCDYLPTCGNGQIEPGEDCEGADLGGASCQSLGFDSGQLTCVGCAFDLTGCVAESCGDGVIDLGEECDGTNFGGVTCESLGYDGGQLGCTGNCRLNTTSCFSGTCGDTIIDPGEECDTNNLGGATCQSLGYAGGQLSCTGGCSFNLTNCTAAAEVCDNGVDDDLDGLCDCLDPQCQANPICIFPTPETNCGDGVDNDHDCLVDCADPDCSNTPACSGEICNNNVDDDGDGDVDCDDFDCVGHPSCMGFGCSPAGTLSCGGAVSGTTVGGTNTYENYPPTCASFPDSGPEAYFRLTYTGLGGSVTVQLNGGATDLDLIVVGGSPTSCNVPNQCLGSSQQGGGNEQVTFTAGLAGTYYVIVDGFGGAAGAFTLSATCN